MRHGGPRVAAISLSVQTETQDGTLKTVHLDGASRRCIQTAAPKGRTRAHRSDCCPPTGDPARFFLAGPHGPPRVSAGGPCAGLPALESLAKACSAPSLAPRSAARRKGPGRANRRGRPETPSEHANSSPLREGPPLRGLKVALTEGICPASTRIRHPSVKVCRSGDSKPLTGMPFTTNPTSQVRGVGSRPRPIAAKRAVEVWVHPRSLKHLQPRV